MNVCVFWIYMQTMRINFTIYRKRHCSLPNESSEKVNVSVCVWVELWHILPTLCARLILSSICVHYFMHAINSSTSRSLSLFLSLTFHLALFLSRLSRSYFFVKYTLQPVCDPSSDKRICVLMLIWHCFEIKLFVGSAHLSFKPPRDVIVLQVNAVINISNKVCERVYVSFSLCVYQIVRSYLQSNPHGMSTR